MLTRTKWFGIGVLVAVALAAAAQTIIPISALPNASTPTGSEYVPLVQSGATVKATTAQLAAYSTGTLTYPTITGLFGCPSSASYYLNGAGGCSTPSSTACTFASPSGLVGPTAVTGSTGDCLDAGSAPAFNEAANYVVTGTWTFDDSTITFNNVLVSNSTANFYNDVTFEPSGTLALNGTTSGSGSVSLSGSVTLSGTTTASPAQAANGIGYMGVPWNSVSGTYGATLNDRGKGIQYSTSGTLDLACSGTFGTGDTIPLIVYGGATVTVTATSGELIWANGSNTIGNRTVTGLVIDAIMFNGAGDCFITGTGIS